MCSQHLGFLLHRASICDSVQLIHRFVAGCLLLQAGKQLAWLTGGDIKEGMHEVVCSDATVQAVERARAAGKSCWRVSSTVFSHISPPVVLKPIAGNLEATEEYQPITVQDYVDGELQMIKLAPATIAA